MSDIVGRIETDAFDLIEIVAPFLAPPEKLSVSEWADKNRRLSPEASAMPGRWNTSLVEFMREPMDSFTEPSIHMVVVKAAAQVAKTETLLNVVGFFTDHEPSPIMVVQPTLDMASAFSKDRIAPMYRDTPVLMGKVADPKSRDGGNTTLHKQFPGGHITIVGANSPSSLASRPIRVVLCDEVDRFPSSAGTEGDPVQLAFKRAATFWNRVQGLVSTPTDAATSRIDAAYNEGDQRRWNCPCPECGDEQVLRWAQVRWESDKPETAYYECEHCGSCLTDAQRKVMVRSGRWVATAEFNGIASFHVTGLMSPFATLADGVREFLLSKGNVDRMRTWTNTYLGETFEESGDRVDDIDLMSRREDYVDQVPEEVTVLTAGIDVQDDRAEIEVVGWGDDYESWQIGYDIIYGDPSTGKFWVEVDQHIKQVYSHPLFGEMAIRLSAIDTGGHHTKRTYEWSRNRVGVIPIKGVGGEGRPLLGRPARNNISKIQLFPVGTHTAKDAVFRWLAIDEPGPGYCHFSFDADSTYFRGLTAEERRTRYHRGFKKIEYHKIRPRNEPLDCRVYALAALEALGIDLNGQRRAKLLQLRRAEAERDVSDEGRAEKSSSRARATKGRSGKWVDRWRT